MSIWLVVLWWYLGVGAVNYIFYVFDGFSILHGGGTLWSRGWLQGLVEMLFFVLFWWVQLLFCIVVGLHNATGWLLGRIMG